MVGVRFRPGAAAPVLRTSVGEMVDLTVGYEDLWLGSAVSVGEVLAAAGRGARRRPTWHWASPRSSLSKSSCPGREPFGIEQQDLAPLDLP
jgi:hypothetical protein